MNTNDQLLNDEQVTKKISMGKTWLFLAVKAGIFPPPYKIPSHDHTKPSKSTRWKASEIDNWIANLSTTASK